MDAYEATRIVFSRIQTLDPENAAKFMGLPLIQDYSEKEMIRLAFGPETLLQLVISKARKDLGLVPTSNPGTPTSLSTAPSPFHLSRQNSASRLPSPLSVASPSSWAHSPFKLDERMESFQRSSRVGDSPVYGRENEKNSIIEFLLADDFNRNNLTVVCIVGESGIGKTSIVQLIYSEERVLDSFDARMLITMPEKSDETRLIKKLIESVTSSSCSMTEADLLEELLIDELSGTKVFVVLDDAENENPCFWNRIITILNHSTRGSVLLVTTKSKDVAEVISASQTYYLNPLPDYCCWKIFWQHIFTGLNTNPNTFLVETGKQLVSKCQHNPLCIKVLAGLLVCLKNEKPWVEILKTDLWNMDGFDGDTLPTLRVGYELLPNDLKKCLHYCSLFPKDYAFAKQQIVRMWMSQGFIISMEGRQPEEVGLQYFDELLLRGFFQYSPIHDVEEDKFIMHDLIRALATNLSPKKGPPVEDPLERIFENCFHFSLNPSKIQMDEMKPLINSDLQSFLALTRFSLQTRINMSILDIPSLSDLFTKCINIRTLDLSCTDIVELPSSVGMLKQLRYLGVNNTKIRSIPRELCSLVSLQTLEAKDCQHLVELPESMMELTNLRHLDVSKKSGCVKMMIGIGQLTNLQSLAVFCVGCEMPYCSIRELKDLNCLSSCLQIAGLENIRYGLDAKEAALHNKVHLNTLWLHWNDNTCIESAESVTISEEVLKNLKPNPNIGELIIRNYRGNLFPTWMGDPSFSKLVSIILDKCLNCSQFPALGGLPSLRHLSVQKLYHLVRLENTDSQFVSKNTPKFPSLEKLNLWEMYDLEELFETSDCDFPCLRTLSISRCPMLKSIPCFSSLLNLSLYCCVELPHLPDFPSLKSLRIDGFQKIKSLELPKDLPALKELEIRHCNELLLVEGLPKLPSLKKLNVVHCPKFESLKNWKPCHSKPTSTTWWFFPKEESHVGGMIPGFPAPSTIQSSSRNSDNYSIDFLGGATRSDAASSIASEEGYSNYDLLSFNRDDDFDVRFLHKSRLRSQGSTSSRKQGNIADICTKLQAALVDAAKYRVQLDEEICKRERAEMDLASLIQKAEEMQIALPKEKQTMEFLHNEEIEMGKRRLELLQEKKKKLQEERNIAVKELKELRNGAGCGSYGAFSEFSLLELYQATEFFSDSHKIGEGGFGCVYKGFLRNTMVAIKMLHLESLLEFEQQVAILSTMRHPNLVTLIGTCSEQSALVYEYLPNGSLEDRLTREGGTPPLTWQVRTRIIGEICRALLFLHSNNPNPIVHGDLKPANILLDANLVSKLSDFGLSRLLMKSNTNTSVHRTENLRGTFAYMDPEFLSSGEITIKSDVYSFGIIVLRLLTGKLPVNIAADVEGAIATDSLHLIIDESAGEWPFVQAKKLANLGLRCAQMRRRKRPDMESEWKLVESLMMAASLSELPSFRSQLNDRSIPSYFRCPIFQVVMKDPHTAADGYTYEAEAIKGWLDSGHKTSPITNLPLLHLELTPNLALCSAIQEWLRGESKIFIKGGQQILNRI